MAARGWTRRRFVSSAVAVGGAVATDARWALAQADPVSPRSQADAPEIQAGGFVPLLESNVARPMRYEAAEGGFAIRNGREFFNRPLYGPNIPFRVDGGDLPEFSLYLAGHGGNLRIGFVAGDTARWLSQCEQIHARYVDGRLMYEVRDRAFGAGGVIHLEALTLGAGLAVQVRAHGLPAGTLLTWAFGGVSGRKGKRNGDVGCEAEPVSRFFQVRPEECRGNRWTVRGGEATVSGGKVRIGLKLPMGAEQRICDGEQWDAGWKAIWNSKESALPMLAGRVSLAAEPLSLWVEVLEGVVKPQTAEMRYDQRRDQLAKIAGAVRWSTPDSLLDGMAGALGIAADAVWDDTQGCVMHGAVAWRNALAGWRGPYALDVLGRHDRMQRHLRHWIAKQNVMDVTNGSGGVATAHGFAGMVKASGEPDKGSFNARSEGLLHSNGDLSHNHYDMNLVFFDALLRHLRWTSDLAFAREVWPALMRHAARERRLFRRDYATAGAETLPLYEAYAAIWASDNLQYNGGGAAHASAYNVFLNRRMAELAVLLGEPAEIAQAHRAEADAICHAMRALLWMPGRGAFAEGRDWLGERTLAESPAVWTVYHAIDSEVTTAQEAWQMAAERLRVLRKVPVKGAGVPEGGWMIPCSDWLPYEWSLTLLCMNENLHFALALFQAGMAEEGYGLLRGSLIDAGYRGLCPGNFPMSFQLDPHRQESQRDFADPIGCASRTIVEGLWGVQPDLLSGTLRLRPQLPAAWEQGSLTHPELRLEYVRIGLSEGWTITPLLHKPVALRLELRGRTVSLPKVKMNGHAMPCTFDPGAVGAPRLIVEAGPATEWKIALQWHGDAPRNAPPAMTVGEGERVRWPGHIEPRQIVDPQGALDGERARAPGTYTLFAAMQEGGCRYLLPLELRVERPAPSRLTQAGRAPERFEPVAMGGLLTGHVREILTRPHAAPRPGLCSLNLPDGLLGGWADFDKAAAIDDAGLRRAGGMLTLGGGLSFAVGAGAAPNCCFLSQWAGDQPQLELALHGRAQAVYLLLACTTFPQATRSVHGRVRLRYADGVVETELRSPAHWWPVEQDYPVDDYVLRLAPFGEPEIPLPVRVDLATGKGRRLDRKAYQGRKIGGGAATVLRVEVDPTRELVSLTLRCELYGVVMGVLGITLAR